MTDDEIEIMLAGLIEPEVTAPSRAQSKTAKLAPERAPKGGERETSVKGFSLPLIQKTEPSSSTERTSSGEQVADSAGPKRRRIERKDFTAKGRPVRSKRKGMIPYEALLVEDKIVLALDDLLTRGPAYAFTLNVSAEIADKAIATGHPARYLLQRMTYRLESLGIDWKGLFTIEIQGRLFHLHGAFLCPPEKVGKARAALRKAAGEWDETRQLQCKTEADPCLGWGLYSTKQHWGGRAIATKMIGPGPGFGRWPFKGRPYAISQDVMAAAKARYVAEREASLAGLKSKDQSILTSEFDIFDKSSPHTDISIAPASTAPTHIETNDAIPPLDVRRVRTPVSRAAPIRTNRHAGRRRRFSHRSSSALRPSRACFGWRALRPGSLTSWRPRQAAQPP